MCTYAAFHKAVASRALATLELIMLKQYVLFVPQFSFSSSDYLHGVRTQLCLHAFLLLL